MRLNTTLRLFFLCNFNMQSFGADWKITSDPYMSVQGYTFDFCLSFPRPQSLFFLPSAACGRGFYKSSSQDLQCSRCPAHSFNDREGSWRCDCEDGYYRALSDPPSVACTSKSAMTWLGNHSADHLVGSEFKQLHMQEKKKTLLNTLQTCSVYMQWSYERPKCVPKQFLCLPVCHYNYVCRLACLFSVLAGC